MKVCLKSVRYQSAWRAMMGGKGGRETRLKERETDDPQIRLETAKD